MQTITTIGSDIAKSVFQIHGVDAGGEGDCSPGTKRRYVVRSSRSCRDVWSVSKRVCAPLVARAPGTGLHCSVDRGSCGGLTLSGEERCGDARRFARQHPGQHAGSGTTEYPSSRAAGAAPHAPSVHPSSGPRRSATGPIRRVRDRLPPAGRHGVEERHGRRNPNDMRVRRAARTHLPGIRGRRLRRRMKSRSWSSTG